MTYQEALNLQKDPLLRELSAYEVIKLELWDDCLLVMTRGGERLRAPRETFQLVFPAGKALVRSGPCPKTLFSSSQHK